MVTRDDDGDDGAGRLALLGLVLVIVVTVGLITWLW